MATENPSEDETEEDLVHCHECGAEIRRDIEICNECGVRQKSSPRTQPPSGNSSNQAGPGRNAQGTDTQNYQTTSENTEYLREYSIAQWLVAIATGFLTFPVGLVVPVYLLYKAQKGTGRDQSGLESWTAILFGIVGILAVEVGGRTAAKVLWGIFVLAIVLGVFLVLGV